MCTITRLLLFVLLLLPFGAFAQSGEMTVTGTVLDTTDEPLLGVSVFVKGTTNGIATDLDGNFTIRAKKGNVLTFSYIGYAPQEVTITDDKPLRIVMQEDNKMLDEVVVTAMGIQRKEASLTYATQEIKGDDLMKVSCIGNEQ